MLLTPTYHVFHMYSIIRMRSLWKAGWKGGKIGLKEQEMVPDVQESVSVDKDGVLTITLNNLSPEEDRQIEVVLTRKSPPA